MVNDIVQGDSGKVPLLPVSIVEFLNERSMPVGSTLPFPSKRRILYKLSLGSNEMYGTEVLVERGSGQAGYDIIVVNQPIESDPFVTFFCQNDSADPGGSDRVNSSALVASVHSI